MPLDPQVERVLEEVAKLAAPSYTELSPDAGRALMREGAPDIDPGLRARSVVDVVAELESARVPVRLYFPESEGPHPTVVFFHGGGWVLGDLETHDAACHELVGRSDCLVAAVEYRLAPEHPFPAAVEDAYGAACWLVSQAGEFGVDVDRLAFLGDSAGGNLAAVAAHLARDRGGPSLKAQVLVYPITDHDFDTGSYRANAEGYLLTRELMVSFWDHYAPLAERDDPRASPLRCEDLRGLAPALVQTAEYDPLRDEGDAYARRLAESDNDVEHHCWEGLIHGFLRLTAQIDRARDAMDEIVSFLRRHGVSRG